MTVPLSFFMKRQKTDKILTVFDEHVPGLGVRVNRSGRQVFILKFNLKGRAVWRTLGSTDFMTLDQARRLASRMKALARGGDDPTDLIQSFQIKEGIALQGVIDVSRFAEIYIDRHAREHKKSWKKDEQRLKFYVLPVLGKRGLSEISRDDLSRLHREIGKRSHYSANRVIEQLHTMFRLATIWGYLPETWPNPASGIKQYKERARDRFVLPSEMPRLAAAIAAHEDPFVRAALQLYLYTGMRKMELLSLRWSYVDLEFGEIRLPDTKNGRPHRIPLAAPALKILASLPKKGINPYVFPGKIAGTHLSRIDKAWQKIRKEARLEDVRLHDLRRTVGSWVVQSSKNLTIVGDILNQTNQNVTRVYSRFTNDHVRDALNAHAAQLSEYF
ncbi:MAG: site-specific integrase [Candidatus Melainabacteria bacterium]|nr:site-specific integrase [Candidatus Melainabacteria bacterium]